MANPLLQMMLEPASQNSLGGLWRAIQDMSNDERLAVATRLAGYLSPDTPGIDNSSAREAVAAELDIAMSKLFEEDEAIPTAKSNAHGLLTHRVTLSNGRVVLLEEEQDQLSLGTELHGHPFFDEYSLCTVSENGVIAHAGTGNAAGELCRDLGR